MPEAASFHIRPNYRRRRTLLLGGLVLAGVVAALLLRPGGPSVKKEPPTPTLNFVATVRGVFGGKAPPTEARKTESDALIKLFNGYYQTAFVDPKKWGDGTFPQVKELFAKDAQVSFTRDIASLTIGEARTELKRVDLQPSDLSLTVYFDEKSKPRYAVAATTFRAVGTLKQAGPSLTINQSGTFYLQKVDGDWRIVAYDSAENQETPTPTPTPTPTASSA